MNLRNQALHAERATLQSLLASIEADDPLGRMSLEDRLEEVEREIAAETATISTDASVTLVFGGQPVIGSRAIDAKFTAKAISDFSDLVATQIASEYAALGSRGPVPNRRINELTITDVVRGSFGFVFEERHDTASLVDSEAKLAVEQVSSLVVDAAADDTQHFEAAIEELDDRVLVSLRNFLRTLDDGSATIRLVEPKRDTTIDAAGVRRARERVDSTTISDSEIDTIQGKLLGLTPFGQRFDMRLADGSLIRGRVAAKFAQDYLSLIELPSDNPTGKEWRVRMKVREVREQNKEPRLAYTLVGLVERLS